MPRAECRSTSLIYGGEIVWTNVQLATSWILCVYCPTPAWLWVWSAVTGRHQERNQSMTTFPHANVTVQSRKATERDLIQVNYPWSTVNNNSTWKDTKCVGMQTDVHYHWPAMYRRINFSFDGKSCESSVVHCGNLLLLKSEAIPYPLQLKGGDSSIMNSATCVMWSWPVVQRLLGTFRDGNIVNYCQYCLFTGPSRTYPSRPICLTVRYWTLLFTIRCAPNPWTPSREIPCTPRCGGWLTAPEEEIIMSRSPKKASAR